MGRICPHRIGEKVDFATADDPNDLWPTTTWTQDTSGTFPMASSASHALGSTGGSETHTLTVDEMPQHQHYAKPSGVSTSAAVQSNAGIWLMRQYDATDYIVPSVPNRLVSPTGGGGAHSVLNPYKAVNRWERVA